MKQRVIPLLIALLAGIFVGWHARSCNLSKPLSPTIYPNNHPDNHPDNHPYKNQGIETHPSTHEQSDSAQSDALYNRQPQDQSSIQNNPVTRSLEQKLKDGGISQATIQKILTFIAQNRTGLLELRYQASQEGWQDSDKYRTAIDFFSDLNEEIKSVTSPAEYDHYLYASGLDNRVIVEQVYSGSQAEALGIQRDDIILKYGSEYIFSMADLIRLTTELKPGQTVLIELMRNGSSLFYSAQSGPLGIEMGSLALSPGD